MILPQTANLPVTRAAVLASVMTTAGLLRACNICNSVLCFLMGPPSEAGIGDLFRSLQHSQLLPGVFVAPTCLNLPLYYQVTRSIRINFAMTISSIMSITVGVEGHVLAF